MIAYRMAEIGVERLEEGASTFIPADAAHPAWREFEAWRAAGHEPAPARPRPEFELPRLWIIGAGGYGREVFSMTITAWGNGVAWKVAGFLNDIPDALDAFPDLPRISANTAYQPQPGDLFICAVGDIPARRRLCGDFLARGASFINLIQHSATVAPSARLGRGVIVEPLACAGAGACIGDFAMLLAHSVISHDCEIGEYAQTGPFSCILGHAKVGAGAFIGAHAVVLPGVSVGAGATVGAGSVVVRDVLPGTTVFGVPAKQLQ